MSNRSEVLSAFLERLQAITVAGGYSCDVGGGLTIGEVLRLGRDDAAAALLVLVGDSNVKFQGEQILIDLPVTVLMMADAGPGGAWAQTEALLADVKRAVETSDRRLGRRLREELRRGAERSMDREPGSATVGITITYWLAYAEVWGNP
jgi:hypothetical protein